MAVVSLTQGRHTTNVLQSGQAEHYPITVMQRLRSEIRDRVMTMRTEKWGQSVIQVETCYGD